MFTNAAALAWAGQVAALELHVPQWKVNRRGTPQNPDRLVLDLDPGPGAGLPECAEVAKVARQMLKDIGLDAVPVTSGSKGIHLYAGLDGSQDAALRQRLRQGAGQGAGVRAARTGRQRHEEEPPQGQGAGRLEPEQRVQDDDRALLAARDARAQRRNSAYVEGARRPRPRPALVRGGAGADEEAQGPDGPPRRADAFHRPARRLPGEARRLQDPRAGADRQSRSPATATRS